MIYLITATGDRFDQFSLCCEMMSLQNYTEPVTWIIVDDGIKNLPTPNIQNWTIVHKILPNMRNVNTQYRNMVAALDECDPKSKIIIIEDDDFYPDTWLSEISKCLDYCELTGIKNNKYYNVRSRSFVVVNNNKHSSLCSTAIKSYGAYNLLYKICKYHKPKFIDMVLWQQYCGKKILNIPNKQLDVIGIKGLDRGSGLTNAHKQIFKHKDNINYDQLRLWTNDYFTNKYITLMDKIINEHTT